MSLSLLTTAVLAGVELAINQVLKLDLSCQQKLATVDGCVLAIKCHSPALEIFLVVRDQNLALHSYYEAEADTYIGGDASALLALLLAKDKNQALYNEDIEIKGDLEFLQTLQKIFSEMDIDWEYQLSKFIGDIPTQTMSDGFSSAKEMAQNTHASLLMDLDEYIHEEKKLFPSSSELETFYLSIDQLRLRLDRAEARVQNIKPE